MKEEYSLEKCGKRMIYFEKTTKPLSVSSRKA